jgi:hypothetical protein
MSSRLQGLAGHYFSQEREGNNVALWFDLLRLQRQKGNVGLTLPFLLGASRTPPGEVVVAEEIGYGQFWGLFEEMRDETPTSHVVRIARCTTLHQPVAALYSRNETMNLAEAIASTAANRLNLFVEHRYRGSGKGPEVVDALWDRIGSYVIRGAFSHNDGEYGPFSSNDLDFISRAARDKEFDR